MRRHTKIIASLVVGGGLLYGPSPAMPPHPDIQARIVAGEIAPPAYKDLGSSLPVYARPDAPSIQPASGFSGPFRALCILVDFSDKPSSVNAVRFDTLIFGDCPGTVRDYYDEVSYNQIDLVTVNLPSALGWKRAPQTYAYYVDNHYGMDSPYPHNSQKLCEDLVDLVDPLVDFRNYDNDNDGYVDMIMISHAGSGAEYTGLTTDLWSHKWSISPRLRDGVNIFDYTVMPEYWATPGDMTIGVYCHELGHVFGLPDLYDTDGSSYGVGVWSLMASGSWNGRLGSSPAHHDAWYRTQLGWLTPTTIVSNQTAVSMSSVETTPQAYRLWTAGTGGSEYFLVENRQRTGYDAALPSSGLLVWHIDNTQSSNSHEWYPGHTTSGHYWVALEQADNQYHLEKKNSAGDIGDPYPGLTANTAFTAVSSPNSESYGASSTFVAITNISSSAPAMTADFAVSLALDNEDNDADPLPVFALEQNYPNPFNPTTAIRYTVDIAGPIEINIYNILGQRVAQIVDGYHLPGLYSAVWNGALAGGIPASSGVYFYELADGDRREVRQMILIR